MALLFSLQNFQLHKLCFKILLGRLQVVPKEIQNNAYVKCLRENKELCDILLRTCLHEVGENGLVG